MGGAALGLRPERCWDWRAVIWAVVRSRRRKVSARRTPRVALMQTNTTRICHNLHREESNSQSHVVEISEDDNQIWGTYFGLLWMNCISSLR